MGRGRREGDKGMGGGNGRQVRVERENSKPGSRKLAACGAALSSTFELPTANLDYLNAEQTRSLISIKLCEHK